MHRLFVGSITPPIFNINNIKQRLIQTYCASSHIEFLTKHPSPLWLNPSFFVSLPFKQNEDVNLTKESLNPLPHHRAPVRSTSAPEFVRHENGLVFPTGIHMIIPTDQEPAQEIKHIWWDVCIYEGCLDEAAKIDDDDEDLPKKRKSSQRKLKRRKPLSPHKPPSPPPHKLSPYNQKALSILHQDSPTKDKELTLSPVFPINKDPSCSYSQEYEQEFLALTAFEHLDIRTKHDWKKKNPTTIGPTGHANTISPAEATLNWQSENAVAQNKVLVKILSQQSMITNSQEYLSSRVRSLESIINELRFKIQELHREIIQIIRTSPTPQHFSSIFQKEAEMKNLKNQLQVLERQHKQKRATSLIDDPWRLPSTPFVGVSIDPQPLPQSYTHTTSPSLNICASEQRKLKPTTKKEPTQESQSIDDVVSSTKTHDILPIQTVNPVSMFLNSLTRTDKSKNSQFIASVIKPQMDYEEFDNAESFEHLFMAEPENAESTVQFDAEDYEENQENPNQKTSTGFPKSDIKQYFTFEDVPPSK
uniref:Putative zinc finger, CCHC-type n=1 Tax=Tanacetum cinerariifolium TaxID=118510 RepID=A0A699L1N7_TANCI|nr:putative zinc finger, CCHC-type [Tanacetum cinerariifolium]